MLASDIAGANSLLRIGQEGELSVGCPNHSGTAWAVWRHGGKDVPLQELPGNGAAGGRRKAAGGAQARTRRRTTAGFQIADSSAPESRPAAVIPARAPDSAYFQS